MIRNLFILIFLRRVNKQVCKLIGVNLSFSIMKIAFIEPFYGGSHKYFIDILLDYFKGSYLYYLPASKWHWRARTSALHFSQTIPDEISFDVLFSSAVLNLAELVALRPDLRSARKITYFHENQLVYPVQNKNDRDFQYGYNQILTALTADVVLFNSNFNKETFLSNINRHLGTQRDCKIKISTDKIRVKCKVLYLPILIPNICLKGNFDILHIVWPHRWEHDKNPDLFFNTLFKLKENKLKFFLTVLGQTYETVPEIFKKAENLLDAEIVRWGPVDNKSDYFEELSKCNVAVSTATHEFFGIAMLEATLLGCFPLAPNTLVYPEIYPKECLFNTPQQLYKKLKMFAEKPYLIREYRNKIDLQVKRFDLKLIMAEFTEIINK